MNRYRYFIAIITALIIGVILPHPTFAQGSAVAITECLKVADRDKRLSCYDRRANELVIERQSQPIGTQPLAAPVARPRIAAVSRPAESNLRPREKEHFWSNWGLKNRDRDRDDQKEFETQLSRFTKNKLGKHTFYLANGQVWRQKFQERLTIHDGDPVLVKRGAMGGIRIKVGNNSLVQVSRVK